MVNVCSQIKCLNRGTCIQKEMDWRCSCQHGWTGLYCDIPNMSCQTVAKNKGERLDRVTNFTATALKCSKMLWRLSCMFGWILNVTSYMLQVWQWTWCVITQGGVSTKTTHTSVCVREVIWAVTVSSRWMNVFPTPVEMEGPVWTTRVDMTARYNQSNLLILIYTTDQKFGVKTVAL